MNDDYDEPYPPWAMISFWGCALLMGIAFWRLVIWAVWGW